MDKVKATLKALWNGDIPLAQTFWLYYVAAIIVLRLLAGLVGPLMGLAILGWAGFMVLPIWRAADKYTGNTLFALLAKAVAILIALGVLSTLF